LKRVFHGMLVLQDGPTRADDHGAVALDQACKSRLGGVCCAAVKLFEQLPVRKAADRADLKKHLNLPEGSPLLSSDHHWLSCNQTSDQPFCNATPPPKYSQYSENFCRWRLPQDRT
jgi:hypothetical protein